MPAIASDLVVAAPVRDALRRNAPLVALESAILTHGLPHPTNLATARAVEAAVRAQGAVPATIALLRGRPHIGLSDDQLETLCAPEANHTKIALRDLPRAAAHGLTGGTTVSATLHLAHAASIRVFATGGIGGVHRGVAASLDISADIPALARYPLLVVCAGAKSILNIPHTLEALETASVPVLVLRAPHFPAFYLPSSGERAPASVDSPARAAAVLRASLASGLSSAVLLAVPLPPRFLPDANVVQSAIDDALADLRRQGRAVPPNQVTPFLLSRVAHRSNGASVRTNVHLVCNNAAVAAQTAVALAGAAGAGVANGADAKPASLRPAAEVLGSVSGAAETDGAARMLVVGALACDLVAKSDSPGVAPGSTVPGRVAAGPGGVGFNVALAAARFTQGLHVGFGTVSGGGGEDDTLSGVLRSVLDAELDKASAGRLHVTRVAEGGRTPAVAILLDGRGDLQTGVADMDSERTASPDAFAAFVAKGAAAAAGLVVLDGNLRAEEAVAVADACERTGCRLWVEPTSMAKARGLAECGVVARAHYVSPNEFELVALCGADGSKGAPDVLEHGLDDASVCALAGILLRRASVAQTVFVTRGARGVARLRLSGGRVDVKIFAAHRVPRGVVSTTGAGDCFVGGCGGALACGRDEDAAVECGLAVAARACGVEQAVPPLGGGAYARL